MKGGSFPSCTWETTFAVNSVAAVVVGSRMTTLVGGGGSSEASFALKRVPKCNLGTRGNDGNRGGCRAIGTLQRTASRS